MDDASLLGRFRLYDMDKSAQANAQSIRADALRLAQKLNAAAKDSREKSEAMTNLEQCVMWATRAIAMHPER